LTPQNQLHSLLKQELELKVLKLQTPGRAFGKRAGQKAGQKAFKAFSRL
jgi:hypothetical protein